tara:strand:- start:307 stop:492 length:186 start_codon:yes stop_codon:yes gene_type:complete
MATVKKNLQKTEKQTKSIVSLAHDLGIKVVFGGQGLQSLPILEESIDLTFYTYNEFKQIII